MSSFKLSELAHAPQIFLSDERAPLIAPDGFKGARSLPAPTDFVSERGSERFALAPVIACYHPCYDCLMFKRILIKSEKKVKKNRLLM